MKSVNNKKRRANEIDSHVYYKEVMKDADPHDESEDHEKLTEKEKNIPFGSLGSDELPPPCVTPIVLVDQ